MKPICRTLFGLTCLLTVGGNAMAENKITQTAGRDQLGEFAPEFAHFNDDVLFGENWMAKKHQMNGLNLCQTRITIS